jgi:hypothetical protein
MFLPSWKLFVAVAAAIAFSAALKVSACASDDDVGLPGYGSDEATSPFISFSGDGISSDQAEAYTPEYIQRVHPYPGERTTANEGVKSYYPASTNSSAPTSSSDYHTSLSDGYTAPGSWGNNSSATGTTGTAGWTRP